MKVYILTFLCLTLVFSTSGCGKDQPDEQASDEAETIDGAEHENTEQGSTKKASSAQGDAVAAVKVAQNGTEFDPAIEPEKLPAGVWYCDMGTVHWAGGDKPESGTCPRCGMGLKQHAKEKNAGEPPARGAHEGDHDHPH